MAAKNTVRLTEAFEKYLDRQQARRRSASTINADLQVIRHFIRLTGDILLTSLTPSHVERYFYGPKGIMSEHASLSYGVASRPGVAPATHNHHRSRLKVFFTWCYDEGYLRNNSLLSRVDPMKVPRRVRQRPAPHVLLGLLDVTDNARDRAFIATAINTGLRSNEIKRLRVGDVDLASGFLYVVISKTKVEDEQPISSDLDAELRAWLVAYAEEIGRPLTDEDYLFPGRIGGLIAGYDEDRQPIRQPMRYTPHKPISETHRIVQKALVAVGLPAKSEGTHTIRRAVARAYFDQVSQEKGDVAALRETAALLHHQNIATTERYLGTTPERENRDRRIKGKPFLTGMVSQENVVQLRPRAEGE